MNKELIKKRFSRKLKIYNENATVQKHMSEKLLHLIPDFETGYIKNILEIGCGTGLLTDTLCKNIKYDRYEALDFVEECREYIQKIDSKIKFINNDIESFVYNDNNYDLIISNASLQWVENLPTLAEKLFNSLTDNGLLLFSTFGTENFKEIYNATKKTLPYYSKNKLNVILKKYSPKIIEEKYVLKFSTPKDVLKHIQATGVNAISTEVWTKQKLAEFENEYNKYCKNSPTLTYNPIYVYIRKS